MPESTLVTGVAGFIGSHVARRLIDDGKHVVGVDCFTDYYSRARKEENIRPLIGLERFRMVEDDLSTMDLSSVLDGVVSVCHLAAQAGVRASWGESFEMYISCNIAATQRLLEAIKERGVASFVSASSSSVYGETAELPMRESGPTRPVSPYGVTKLASEHLTMLYHSNYGVPSAALRYFTVYGPRQRPDMGFYKFVRAGLSGDAVTVFGDGSQTRDFTFVDDIVDATVTALDRVPAGEVINVGGGSRVTLLHALEVLEEILGIPIERTHIEPQRGDVTDTLADNSKARELLEFDPKVSLEEGLRRQVEWMKSVGAE